MVENLVCQILVVFYFLLIARIILSWFPVTSGGALASVVGVLYSVTEPVLGPVRRALPPLSMGGMGFDLSPIVVFIGLRILQGVIGC